MTPGGLANDALSFKSHRRYSSRGGPLLGDTAHCLEWFVYDGIREKVNLFVIDGDLTTYKATIKERNLWIDMVIRMADHAPVLLVAGNHGRESDGDLYALAKARGHHRIHLSTEPELVEFDQAVVAVFPYPRKSEVIGTSEG